MDTREFAMLTIAAVLIGYHVLFALFVPGLPWRRRIADALRGSLDALWGVG